MAEEFEKAWTRGGRPLRMTRAETSEDTELEGGVPADQNCAEKINEVARDRNQDLLAVFIDKTAAPMASR